MMAAMKTWILGQKAKRSSMNDDGMSPLGFRPTQQSLLVHCPKQDGSGRGE